MSPSPDAPSYTPFSGRLIGSLDDISGMIHEHAKMVDLIQEVALELTGSITTLHTLTGQYVGMGDEILGSILPILRGLPIVPKQVMETMTSLEGLTKQIVDSKDATHKTLADVQESLTTGDVAKLQGRAAELQQLTRSLAAILPK
jgi:hypothetical protein